MKYRYDINPIQFIINFIKLNKKDVIIIYIIITILAILNYLSPFILRILIDEIVPSKDYKALNLVFILLMTFIFIKYYISFIKDKISYLIGITFVKDVRNYFFDKVVKIKYKIIIQYDTGYLFNRLYNEVNDIDDFLKFFFSEIAFNICSFAIGIAMLYNMSLGLCIIMLMFSPAYYFIYKFFKNKVYIKTKEVYEKKAYLESYVLEYLKVVPIIKEQAIANSQQNKINSMYQILNDKQLKLQIIKMISSIMIGIYYSSISMIITWIGYYKLMNSDISMGTVISIQIYIFYILDPLESFVQIANRYQILKLKLKRLNEIDKLPCYSYHTNLNEVNNIEFKSIGFHYIENRKILNNINLTIKRGDLIGIYGDSGTGKSTLSKIICGYLSPEKGTVLVNDKSYDINEVNSILINNVHYCSQMPQFIKGTLIENITFKYKKDLAKSEIDKAMKLIDSIKIKINLNDEIDEEAKNFSGGQKQIINILRALFFEKTVTIFDETFSQIDYKQKNEIITFIKQYFENNKLNYILISHDLDFLKNNVDKVYKIEKKQLYVDDKQSINNSKLLYK